IDYDDTHLKGIVHVASVLLPAIFTTHGTNSPSGTQALRAFVIGSEIFVRLGLAANGRLNQVGVFPTGQLGVYAGAVSAGIINGLNDQEIVHAQGLAGAMSAGSLEFLSNDSWTKPFQAGWAASSAMVAARFAMQGFRATSMPYTGRFGIFSRYFGESIE